MSLFKNNPNKVSKLYEKTLEGDYAICSKCDGTGIQPDCDTLVCDKCWGEGLLDWIEQIMGKECPFALSGMSATSSSSSISATTHPVVSRKAVKNYIDFVEKRRKHEYNNNTRSRTVQRFYKMFNKFKRRM